MQQGSHQKPCPPTVLRLQAMPQRTTTERLTTETLGPRIRQMRGTRDLTQAELAGRGKLSHSALSKIENGQLSPTFDTLLRIAAGLEVDIAELLASSGAAPQRTRRAVTRGGHGERFETDNYAYETLGHEIAGKRMIPLVARIKEHSLEAFGPLTTHPGEEVIYVLSGGIELHTEHYAPVALERGDCVYFDSTMGHACISTSKEDAFVFWVSTPA